MSEYYKIFNWVDILGPICNYAWPIYENIYTFKIKYNIFHIYNIWTFLFYFFSLGSGKKNFFFPICTFIFLLHLLSPKLLSLFILLLDYISHFFSLYLSHQGLFSNLDNLSVSEHLLNNQEKLIFIVLWRVIWVT